MKESFGSILWLTARVMLTSRTEYLAVSTFLCEVTKGAHGVAGHVHQLEVLVSSVNQALLQQQRAFY